MSRRDADLGLLEDAIICSRDPHATIFKWVREDRINLVQFRHLLSFVEDYKNTQFNLDGPV